MGVPGLGKVYSRHCIPERFDMDFQKIGVFRVQKKTSVPQLHA